MLATGLCSRRVFGLRWSKGRSGLPRAVMRRTKRPGSSSRCLASEHCNPSHVPAEIARFAESAESAQNFGDLASDSGHLTLHDCKLQSTCTRGLICSAGPLEQALAHPSSPTFDWVGSGFPQNTSSGSRTRSISASDALATLAYASGRRTVDFGRQEHLQYRLGARFARSRRKSRLPETCRNGQRRRRRRAVSHSKPH